MKVVGRFAVAAVPGAGECAEYVDRGRRRREDFNGRLLLIPAFARFLGNPFKVIPCRMGVTWCPAEERAAQWDQRVRFEYPALNHPHAFQRAHELFCSNERIWVSSRPSASDLARR